TTTSAVTGSEIGQYLGPVVASAEAAAGQTEPSLSVVRDAASAAPELPTLDEARAKVVSLLEEAAKVQGADAIIDFRVDHETMTGPNGPAVLLTASGTAVRLAGAGGGTLAAIKERAKKGGAGAA